MRSHDLTTKLSILRSVSTSDYTMSSNTRDSKLLQNSTSQLHRKDHALHRAYHSEISLAPGGAAAATLSLSRRQSAIQMGSESNIRRSHPLLNDLDDHYPHAFGELILAAETLENIVNESVFVGATPLKRVRSGSVDYLSISRDNMGDRVLKLVYGTMTCKSE